MATRGRKSSASIALVPTTAEGERIEGGVTSIQRAQPPVGLGPREAEIWGEVVDDLPASWFPRHTHEVLAAYCRHAATLERLDSLIRAIENPPPRRGRRDEEADDDGLDLDRYEKLLRMRDKESRTMQAHARSLRITVQSTRAADAKKPPKRMERPWE